MVRPPIVLTYGRQVKKGKARVCLEAWLPSLVWRRGTIGIILSFG